MYISSLVYGDDSRVVVTVDEQLPTIEISDSPATSSIGSDFVWLAKVRTNIKSFPSAYKNGLLSVSDSCCAKTISLRNGVNLPYTFV